MFTDSHCHLDSEKFAADLDAVLERAAAVGVTRLLSIGTGELDCAVRVAERYPEVFATIGVHPHDAAKFGPQTPADLRSLADNRKVIAFGEIGLDYHYDFAPREVQREVFTEQLKLAAGLNLPITIHTREAWDDTIAILRANWSGRGIMHCFTGDPVQAQQALDLGFYLSYAGVTTFKTAESVRQSLRITPHNRLLIETDAPYLAPIPWRGKRNEPSFMVETAKRIAEILALPLDRVAQLTTENFNRITQVGQAVPPVLRYTGISDGN
jgi:TatD DNase family protein